MLFQNRKNKILSGPKILRERIQNGPFFVRHQGAIRALVRALVEQRYSAKARFAPWFPKKRRAWDSNPRATSAVPFRAFGA